jgi:Family of unknown function (DUF5832)
MSTFERKLLETGSPNPKYVDLLDEDPPIAGQKYAIVSFLSPENILKKRELYLFEQFVKQWEFSKSMSKTFDFLHFISYKYNLKVDDVMNDYNDFVKEEEIKLREGSMEDDYKTYIEKNEDILNEKFNKEHAFQTSVRGVKIRGVFGSIEEAREYAKEKIMKIDPNHNTHVGPVGIWMCWDPDAYKTGKIEFMEEELNQLYSEKMKNEEKAKEEFERRVKETKRKAIQDNIELAKKSGNKLTQTITEDGQLIGVRETVNFDERDVADTDVKSVDMRNEILNGNK